MYFPYLYDKQSELLALRSLAGGLGRPQKIIPLVEPVNTASGLARWHGVFKAAGDIAYVIENPSQQVLADATALGVWQAETAALFADRAVIRPTFREATGTSISDIRDFIASHGVGPIGLVVTTSRLPAIDIANVVRGANCLVFMTAGADRVALTGLLTPARTIEVNDRFPAQRVNADYSGAEWFTRDHLDYLTSGHTGFSDYTVLPAKPTKRGGGSVGAVVIHLTYEAADDTIWISHFLSDEQGVNVGTSGGKLLEACAHVDAEVGAHPAKFDTSPALARYRAIFAAGAESSLGKNKELQIAHHLYSVGKRLGL